MSRKQDKPRWTETRDRQHRKVWAYHVKGNVFGVCRRSRGDGLFYPFINGVAKTCMTTLRAAKAAVEAAHRAEGSAGK